MNQSPKEENRRGKQSPPIDLKPEEKKNTKEGGNLGKKKKGISMFHISGELDGGGGGTSKARTWTRVASFRMKTLQGG